MANAEVKLVGADWERLAHIPEALLLAQDLTAHGLAEEVAVEMRTNAPRAFETLSTSIRVDKKSNAEYLVGPHVKYAGFVEFGRESGGPPPTSAIKDWMAVKGIRLPETQQNQVAFLIARKIGDVGTKSQRFVTRYILPTFVESDRLKRRFIALSQHYINEQLA